jgi:hypothetical protein
MRGIMKMPKRRVEFYRNIAQLDVQDFMDAASEFIDEVRRAAADL